MNFLELLWLCLIIVTKPVKLNPTAAAAAAATAAGSRRDYTLPNYTSLRWLS